MLEIHGNADKSAEYLAAEALGKIAVAAIPDIEEARDIVLKIFPSVQCYGQKVQDVDLLVFFAD